MAQRVDALLDVLHKAHLDNSEMEYFALKNRGRRLSIMPVTPFVFEYFLFNSIYQIDWGSSLACGDLVDCDREVGESKQQRCLVKFIRGRWTPEQLYRAFEPLLYVGDMKDDWAMVVPDSRISEDDGKKFFGRMVQLRSWIHSSSSPEEMPSGKNVSDLICKALYFVYLVRNNIFHGSKSLGDIYDDRQKKRIEVYEVFLKGVTSLFFLVMGKDKVAADLVPCHVLSGDTEVMSRYQVQRASRDFIMRQNDPRLIYRVQAMIANSDDAKAPSDNSALFYPSAGRDFITPILLGLNCCTNFYFYDHRENWDRYYLRPARDILRTIHGLDVRQDWVVDGDRHILHFNYGGNAKRILCVRADNTAFLRESAELAFFFYRGDSSGEGGSGQDWSGSLMRHLSRKVPKGSSALFLVDMKPKINSGLTPLLRMLDMPLSSSDRKYYFGRLVCK